MTTGRRFVVLDRDGTLIQEKHYLSDPDKVELIPGAPGALRKLRDLGLGVVIATNQSAIGRGFFDMARLEEIHRRMLDLLSAEGVAVDGIYVCPHAPEDDCDCRKPRVGLLSRAARDFGFDPQASFVVGDKASDIEFGLAARATTILVKTGYGEAVAESGDHRAHHVAQDLIQAADLIEGLLGRTGESAVSVLSESKALESRSDPYEGARLDFFLSKVRLALFESARVKQETASVSGQDILRAAKLITETFRNGGKVLLCGNGGSAADCQHMAAEFVNILQKPSDRPALPALALTTDSSVLTAVANDTDFGAIFARQVAAHGKPGDVLIGISTSGNSPNVLRAVEEARSRGLTAITLTGSGGRLAELADVAIRVPSANTQYIQESHLAVEHIICGLVEEALFAGGGSGK